MIQGLLRISCSRNPARYSHIVKLALYFYAHVLELLEPSDDRRILLTHRLMLRAREAGECLSAFKERKMFDD